MHSSVGNCVSHQQGAALIVAILVLGLVAMISVLITSEHQIAVYRAKNQIAGEQAFQYLLGAEELAVHLLREDLLNDKQTKKPIDHLNEAWAKAVMPFSVDGGELQVSIQDLQGRLNINGMVPPEGDWIDPRPLPTTPLQRNFVRLLLGLESLELGEEQAVEILESLVDWMDENQDVTGFGGAEDNTYEQMTPPYLSGNRALAAPSELLQLPEMTPEIYGALEPHISVWPEGGSAININTATAPVLAALNAGGGSDSGRGLNNVDTEMLLLSRTEQGFNSIGDFIQSSVWGGRTVDGPTLSVRSHWFIAYSRVELQGAQHQLTSILWRDEQAQQVKVIARSLGGF